VRWLLATATPMIEDRGLTLVGVTLVNLERAGAGVQLALPVDGVESAALDTVLDEVRERFGADALTRAALLDRGRGLSAWLHPGEEPPRAP